MYVKFGKQIWIYKLIIWHLLASVHQPTEFTRTVYWCMPSKWKASQNLFLNKNDPFLHGSDCNFCNTIKYVHFIFIIYVWCIPIIQEHWWMTVHISVMEIQIWSIISGNWNMNFYELPMIFSNSYPVTSLVEWWNLSLYKGKIIHYLTKQFYYSNFESLIYGPIVRFSINWILKI